MTLLGSTFPVSIKLIYSTKAINLFGETVYFEKPFFLTFVCFFAMSIYLMISTIHTYRMKSQQQPEPHPNQSMSTDLENQLVRINRFCGDRVRYDWNDGVNESDEGTYLLIQAPIPRSPPQPESEERNQIPSIWTAFNPTILDISSMIFSIFGLLFSSISVFQILRSSMLIWKMVLPFSETPAIARSKFYGFLSCIVGTAMVVVSTLFSCDNTDKTCFVHRVYGIVFIHVGQILQVLSISLKERKLTPEIPKDFVGWQGVWGVLHFVIWIFPATYFAPGYDNGQLENVLDSLYTAIHSWKIASLIGVCILIVILDVFYTSSGRSSLSFHQDVIVECFQVVCVWGFEILMPNTHSQGLTNRLWWIELIGFVLLVCGILYYHQKNHGNDENGGNNQRRRQRSERRGNESTKNKQVRKKSRWREGLQEDRLRVNSEGYLYLSDEAEDFNHSFIEETARKLGLSTEPTFRSRSTSSDYY